MLDRDHRMRRLGHELVEHRVDDDPHRQRFDHRRLERLDRSHPTLPLIWLGRGAPREALEHRRAEKRASAFRRLSIARGLLAEGAGAFPPYPPIASSTSPRGTAEVKLPVELEYHRRSCAAGIGRRSGWRGR